MSVKVLTIFVVSIIVPLVVSGCSSLKPTTKNVQELCIAWWDEASGARSYSKTRADCLLLLKTTCPDMITISVVPTKSFQGSHELWVKNGLATPSDGRYGGLSFVVEEKKPVCFDDNGKVKDCNWWWGLAKNKDVKTKYRATCIDRILRHCEDKIQITEERPCESQGAFSCKGGKVVTYSYGGETTTIAR